MVIFIVEPKEGSPIKRAVVIGLSRMNINRLTAGKPIILRADHGGVNVLPAGWEICITFGESEQAIVQEMKDKGLIGEATEIVDQTGGRRN